MSLRWQEGRERMLRGAGRLFPALLLWLPLLLLACGGSPPHTELNAAADALEAAELARDCAPEEYRAAQRLLDQARAASEEGDYTRAQQLAISAQQQAERARLTAQANLEECRERMAGRDGAGDDEPVAVADPWAVDEDYELTPVYFAFDGATLDREARSTLERHARFFSQNSYRIVIEGHCDSRGTDAYNLALGEARARAVAQHLVTLGIEPSRLQTVSYGKFRPASATEYALNRRAEFRLRQ